MGKMIHMFELQNTTLIVDLRFVHSMLNANRDEEIKSIQHQKQKISAQEELKMSRQNSVKKIMIEAIDAWKKDIFDVDDARYGIYLSHKSVELSATRPLLHFLSSYS